MTPQQTFMRHWARVTIEFTTPFLVGSGESDMVVDVTPVWDANDLPAIPGSSIAGVLRHAYSATHAPSEVDDLFGAGGEDGRGSRLWVTWGHVHGSDDRAVDGLRTSSSSVDPVLGCARASTVRDHVRIDHRGTAARAGKFDQSVICAGHRFTFDLEIEGGDGRELDALLALLEDGELRLGRSGHRGLGAFVMARHARSSFNLKTAEDRRRWFSLPRELSAPLTGLLAKRAARNRSNGSWSRLELELEPLECWSFGGGNPWESEAVSGRRASGKGKDRLPDLAPIRDQRVVWTGGRGQVSAPTMFVPGSAVKGALAHRVAFHANALIGRFAERSDPDACSGERCPEVAELFGTADAHGRGTSARAGRVRIDDVFLGDGHGRRLLPIQHNGLDRFTGGTRPGVLFEELVIDGGPPLRVTIAVNRWYGLTQSARDSFRLAIRDLVTGRLQLGAGAGRGHGYFEDRRGIDSIWGTFLKESKS